MARRGRPKQPLTIGPRTQQVMDYLKQCAIEGRFSPTLREIMREVGITSSSVAQYHVNILVELGKVDRNPVGRLDLHCLRLARYSAHVIRRRGNVVTLALYRGDEEKIHEDKFYHIEVYEDDSL